MTHECTISDSVIDYQSSYKFFIIYSLGRPQSVAPRITIFLYNLFGLNILPILRSVQYFINFFFHYISNFDQSFIFWRNISGGYFLA